MSTAKVTYKKRQTEIKQQMKKLETALKKHQEHFNKKSTDWGYAADLGHVKSVIAELANFINSSTKQ